MSNQNLPTLMKEIEINKKELIDISNRTRSLIHHSVIEKSQKLDELIYKYHNLVNQSK